jgi:dUTP pyrophosphatase
MVTLNVDRVIAAARVPERSYEDDAGYDLFACEHVEIPPLGRARVRTGIRLELRGSGLYGLIVPRSGLAVQHGITVLNAPGIVDQGYTGEIRVVLFNADPTHPFRVKIGNRIAQIIFQPYAPVQFEDIPWYQGEPPVVEGTRADAGFGSTGE